MYGLLESCTMLQGAAHFVTSSLGNRKVPPFLSVTPSPYSRRERISASWATEAMRVPSAV